MYGLRRPNEHMLDALVDAQRARELTYDDIGVTTTDLTPAGHRRHAWQRVVGDGADAFDRSADAIRAWAGHRRAGAIVHPADAPIEVGSVVALALPVMGVWVTAACRVVWVVDEPDAFGFGYGTLPHHPESGEESFVVRRREDGAAVVEIVAVSRPQTLLTKLAGPIGSLIQRRTAQRYLTGLAGAERASGR